MHIICNLVLLHGHSCCCHKTTSNPQLVGRHLYLSWLYFYLNCKHKKSISPVESRCPTVADCPRCRQVGSDALALVSTGVSAMCWYCSGVPCLHTSLQSLLHSTQTATKGMTVLKVMKKEMYIYAVTFKHIQTCTYTGHSLALYHDVYTSMMHNY